MPRSGRPPEPAYSQLCPHQGAECGAEGQARTYDQVWDDFQAVRKQTVRRLSAFNDKDLNDPERYTWLKDHPLSDWIAENSFSHEKEHTAQIKASRLKQGL